MKDPDEKPILIELDPEEVGVGPEDAPSIGGPATPDGRAMQLASTYAAGRSLGVGRWFFRLLLAVLGFLFSVAIWDAMVALLERSPILGGVGVGLVALMLLLGSAFVLREFSALARLRRTSDLRALAEGALADDDLGQARAFSKRLDRFYSGRAELSWSRTGVENDEIFEAETTLAAIERELLAPLDQAAEREIEAAARQVAVVTALVPMALADVAVALLTNVRMIRRIAEIYGGRSGSLGAWRLARRVMTHLVATGAMSVGEDLLGSVGGGHLLSKISRRFGEGLVNGALTTRVGIAAVEICRPMPFINQRRPKTGQLVRKAFADLIDIKKDVPR